MTQNVFGTALDFRRFLAEPTRGFSDRAWVFEDLHSWLTENDGPRFFLLSGEPGSGKTAIAARLCQFSLGSPSSSGLTGFTPGFLSAYHFCSIQSGGLIHPQTFAESLALQLSARYQAFAQALVEMSSDQRIQLSVEQRIDRNSGQATGIQIKKLSVSGILPEDVFNRLVRRPLQALFVALPTTQVMILVDALDEALAYPGTRTIVSLLGQTDDLPLGVRFILTCRNGSGIVERFNSKHHLDLSAPEHSPGADDNIRRYVQRRLAEEVMKGHVTAIGSLTEVEDQLVKQASGNFLYAQFFIDEVVSGKRLLNNLEGLPIGLYGLYRDFLDRLPDGLGANKTNTKWTRRLQPLLGSLSVATPAAPQSVLSGWLRLKQSAVSSLLFEASQLTERELVYGGSYRLYHRSMAEFLITREYQEGGAKKPNWYYTPPLEQHERIVRYYLANFRDEWQDCDSYGLRQLVSHMQARLSQETIPKRRRELVEDLYVVVLDQNFRAAQLKKLGDIHATLTDLRTTLEIALQRNDLIKALACIGAYRGLTQSQSISQAVFDAAEAGKFELALQCASHYSVTPKPSGVWENMLRLYIAWEAAEQGHGEVVQQVISGTGRLPFFRNNAPFYALWSRRLSDAFLVRIANTLTQTSGNALDAFAWLTQWGAAQEAQALLTDGQQRQLLLDGRRFNEQLGTISSVETLCFFGRELPTTTSGVVRFAAEGQWSEIDWSETEVGDGTVPERSAVHPRAQEKLPFVADHGSIYADSAVHEFLTWELIDKFYLPEEREERERAALITERLTIVFEPDKDVYGPGEEIRCWATVHRNDEEGTPPVSGAIIEVQPVWHQALPGGQQTAPAGKFPKANLWESEQTPGRYEGILLAPLNEGYYQLKAAIRVVGEPTVVLEELIAIEAMPTLPKAE